MGIQCLQRERAVLGLLGVPGGMGQVLAVQLARLQKLAILRVTQQPAALRSAVDEEPAAAGREG